MFGPAIPEHSIILLLSLVLCVIAPFVLLCGLAFFAMVSERGRPTVGLWSTQMSASCESTMPYCHCYSGTTGPARGVVQLVLGVPATLRGWRRAVAAGDRSLAEREWGLAGVAVPWTPH
jgi:hypothetical protein